MKPPKLWVVAKLFPCDCGAKINAPCIRQGRIVATHESRLEKAREQLRKFDMSPLRFDCPTCKAVANDYCRDLLNGRVLLLPLGWHSARVDAAKALEREFASGSTLWSVRTQAEAAMTSPNLRDIILRLLRDEKLGEIDARLIQKAAFEAHERGKK